MIILGLTVSHHDGAVSIVKDGKLIFALSKERLTKIKKDGYGNEEKLIKYALKETGIKLKDIDVVAFSYDTGYVEATNQNKDYIKFIKENKAFKPINADNLKQEYVELEAVVGDNKIPAYQVNHQLSHCAYSFYTSNKKNAVCLSLDASGFIYHTSSLIALGCENNLKIIKTPKLYAGLLYCYFTAYIGLGDALFKAGSLMGLASYGSVLDYAKKSWKLFNKTVTGKYNSKTNRGYVFQKVWLKLTEGLHTNEDHIYFKKDSKKAMDLAASTQFIFEKLILNEVNKIYYQIKNHDGVICLSGGSFLNCGVNTKILKETKFKEVIVRPASGDDGLSAGSALYVAHSIFNEKRTKYEPQDLIYLGGKIKKLSFGERYCSKKIARLISEGKVVAWVQGRSEFGPRALGNRSFLADPRNKNMRDYLNFKIKEREWFRPFAPSVLKEKVSEWFDWYENSSYMLHTTTVLKPKQVPAITHIDNTARIQTVSYESNPRFYLLIKEFENITGVPMLLNTSLNLGGDPLVESTADALNLFESCDVDVLVVEDRVLYK